MELNINYWISEERPLLCIAMEFREKNIPQIDVDIKRNEKKISSREQLQISSDNLNIGKNYSMHTEIKETLFEEVFEEII